MNILVYLSTTQTCIRLLDRKIMRKYYVYFGDTRALLVGKYYKGDLLKNDKI